jgi:hypothetical protein
MRSENRISVKRDFLKQQRAILVTAALTRSTPTAL